MLACSALALSISAACADADSVAMSGWSQLWLPIRKPWVRSPLTVEGLTAWFTPMLKNVAATPASSRIAMTASVLAPGPSSNVRATVLPLPGAKWLTPEGAAGQPDATAAADWRGAGTVDGSTASTFEGGHGPSGRSTDAVPTDGCDAPTGAACAAGAPRQKAPTIAAASSTRPAGPRLSFMLNTSRFPLEPPPGAAQD